MSEQLTNIAKRLGDGDFHQEVPGVALMLTKEAVTRLCWGSMHYLCEKCAFRWQVWMALGVEGPAALRDAGIYMASPFSIPCPAWPLDGDGGMRKCDGLMSHTDFRQDQEWEAPRIAPDHIPRFVLPRSVWRPDSGADLEIPGPALISARRWHSDQAEKEGPGGWGGAVLPKPDGGNIYG